jgi:hypothetical protein
MDRSPALTVVLEDLFPTAAGTRIKKEMMRDEDGIENSTAVDDSASCHVFHTLG